jgi:hypothetical protein
MPRPRKLPNKDGHLRCSKCMKFKPTSEFGHVTNTWSGFNSKCKDCVSEYNREHNKIRTRETRTQKIRVDVEASHPYSHPDTIEELVQARLAYQEAETMQESEDALELIQIIENMILTGHRRLTRAQREARDEETYEILERAAAQTRARMERDGEHVPTGISHDPEDDLETESVVYQPQRWGPPA